MSWKQNASGRCLETVYSIALCMLIAVVIPFALTLVVGKRRLSSKELGTEERSEAPDAEASPVDVPAEGIARALVSPLSGTVAPIDEMPDAVLRGSQGHRLRANARPRPSRPAKASRRDMLVR